MTPEEYFLGEEPQPFRHTFDPKFFLNNDANPLQLGEKISPVQTLSQSTPVKFTKTNKLDIVVFCGSPGAGKSTFYWNKLQPLGYERVNQDILKTVSFMCMLKYVLRATITRYHNANFNYVVCLAR